MCAKPTLTDKSKKGWPVLTAGVVCKRLALSAIASGSKAGLPVVRGNSVRIRSSSGSPGIIR
jgi:hypothetical protein